MSSFASYNAGDPWTGTTRTVWGVGWVAAVCIITAFAGFEAENRGAQSGWPSSAP